MAGHSKWANIKFKKAAQDAKRGKLFTKLIREITVAARIGGGDTATNPRLRAAIDKALAGNMTRDTIDRAVKRGSGEETSVQLEEIRYEGYGPHGVAILIECMSDNRTRTVAEVRHCLSKNGGNLGTDGSVAYLFQKIGQIIFEPGADEDKVTEIALEYNADDVITQEDGSIEIQSSPDQGLFNQLVDAFKQANLDPLNAEISWVATTEVLLDADKKSQHDKLIEMLEDLDDVQGVFDNAVY